MLHLGYGRNSEHLIIALVLLCVIFFIFLDLLGIYNLWTCRFTNYMYFIKCGKWNNILYQIIVYFRIRITINILFLLLFDHGIRSFFCIRKEQKHCLWKFWMPFKMSFWSIKKFALFLWNCLPLQNLPDGELSPGLSYDRRGYSPLYYWGCCII